MIACFWFQSMGMLCAHWWKIKAWQTETLPKNILISVSLLPDKHVKFNLLWHRLSNVLAMEEAVCGCWSPALLIADTKNKSSLSPHALPYPSVSTGTLYPLTSKHRGEAKCKGKWSDGTESLTKQCVDLSSGTMNVCWKSHPHQEQKSSDQNFYYIKPQPINISWYSVLQPFTIYLPPGIQFEQQSVY